MPCNDQENRERTCLRQAAAQGANLALLPEMFNCPYENACFPVYGEPAGGETWQFLSGMARELGIYLAGGSVPEIEGEAIYNTCYLFSPQGEELARHRKVHLFDIDVPGGQRFMESDTLTAGSQITVVDTALGKLGLAICFDIRFAEFFRVMGDLGAQLILVPAAFNMTTGPLHWDLAFRMRALDQQCFVAGCSPARDRSASYVAYGHSLVCNPWGEILTDCAPGSGLNLLDKKWRIYGRTPTCPPTYIGKTGDVGNSAVAKGCTVLGEVKNAVLSTGTTVAEGASVSYSVVMPGAVIEAGAKVSYAIVGEGCRVGRNAVVGGAPGSVPFEDWGIAVLGPRTSVADGAVIEPKMMLGENGKEVRP